MHLNFLIKNIFFFLIINCWKVESFKFLRGVNMILNYFSIMLSIIQSYIKYFKSLMKFIKFLVLALTKNLSYLVNLCLKHVLNF